MDSDVLISDDNESSNINDFLPEGIGSDASFSSPSASSSLPDCNLDDSNSTPEDLPDDDDDRMSSDSGSDDKDDDGDDNAMDDNDTNDTTQGPSTDPSSTPVDPSAEADANLTLSFLSVPDDMKPSGSQPKGKRKSAPRAKSKALAGPKKKRRKKGQNEDEEESNGGDEAEGVEVKKKKKNKPPQRRRNIKKFLTHGELTADTLTAQQEEEERRKRLEEQKNAAALNGAFAIPPELMEILGPQPPLDSGSQGLPTSVAATVDIATDLTPTPAAAPTAAAEQSEEECIVLGSSSSEGEEEASRRKSRDVAAAAQKKDVIEISSDEDGVTILSDEDDDEELAEGGGEEEEVSGMHTNDALNQPDIFGRVLVNVTRPQDEEDIFLPPQIARSVKPHQIGGIRFLYDNLVESLSRFRVTLGFGCILAHSMGLGKTLQMISFIDIFLRHTEAKTVLCIVPINTIQNWVAEFNIWLPERRSNGVLTENETRNKKKGSSRKAKPDVTNSETKPLDNTESGESMSLPGDSDSRGDTATPTMERLPGNEDASMSSCDGQASSSTSTKSSPKADGEDFPEEIVYRQFPLYVMNDTYRNMAARHQVITTWHKTGGVLLMGYEMYRLLSLRGASASSTRTSFSLSKHLANRKKKKKKKASDGADEPEIIDLEEEDKNTIMAEGLHKALCRPGPDLVVCDEGHRIKNIHAGISQALKNIRTRRRVVLTGYPLQNNLQEYWCMVDFVRPNFLGTRHEFANLFERPIQNGQCIDSTQKDMQLMRFRAHVLFSLLEGFVQRRGFSVLHSTLPPKEESVLLVRLTPFQRGLYIKFMQSFTEMGAGGWCSANPLKAFSVGCKIWNHPDILCDVLQKRDEMADLDTDLDLPETSARCSKKGKKDGAKSSKKAAAKPACEAKKEEADVAMGPAIEQSYQEKVNQIISFEWARDIMKNYQPNKLYNGGKMMLLFEILEASIKVGDRLLVFSQSLSTLSLIEKFLAERTMPEPPDPPSDFDGKWVRNKTYFRLDGSTPASDREKMINQFNHENNKHFWLFLLSTRAGCLGINLIGANRVIVLDASWNPCHDAQAVCRVYRYGQKKKCHVYRMVTDNTLEKKIYDRQISKKGMSDRVVDELNPEMNLTKKEVESLLEFDADADDTPYEDFSNVAVKYTDAMLVNICNEYSNFLSKAPFSTESLIWDRKDRRLTRAEKRMAKKSYEEEKKLRVSYARPSYQAFYPKDGNPPMTNVQSRGGSVMQSTYGMPGRGAPQFYTRPIAGMHPVQSTPVPRFHPGLVSSGHQQRLAELQQAGVSMQKIVATTDIVLPGVNTHTSGPVIKAGQTVTFIRTQKGLYLRTTDGRILAVRGPSGTETSKAHPGMPPFNQFTTLASAKSQAKWGITTSAGGLPSVGGSSGISKNSVGGSSGIGSSAGSVSAESGSGNLSNGSDGANSNNLDLQHLLDKSDITDLGSLPQFTSSGSTMGQAHHLGYPQSLQSLNNLGLQEIPQGTQNVSLGGPSPNLPASLVNNSGMINIPTTASILSSTGRLASIAPTNNRLPLHRNPLAGGTVPLAAIGMFAPRPPTNLSTLPSTAMSVAPSSSLSLPQKAVTDANIPLTLNSLLDGDPVRMASEEETQVNDPASEQSAIVTVESDE
ncbi:helicase ARIP4-like [Patiria miniata]|uniref:Helicase ARIP4 n=1 Tax=Patiria miniata TaxID=46514 RepID=A0A914B051_PATMI|nr:helicase ARIP4-like [Patiria miniata]